MRFLSLLQMSHYIPKQGEGTHMLGLKKVCNLRQKKSQSIPKSLLAQFNHFSSVAQSCPTLCAPMDCSIPGLPVHHQLLECTQSHFHWVGDVIQPSHPLLTPSPPPLNLFQHQGLSQWVSSSHQAAKVLESQLQHQLFQWLFRTDFL